MIRLVLLCLSTLLLFPGAAAGIQNFTVRDGASITAIISSHELTRVTVVGSQRLEKVWAPAGTLWVQPDEAQGDIFIKPVTGAPATMSFFVRDGAGGTYTIIAQQRDVPSETILLNPELPTRQTNPHQTRRPSFFYVQEIKRLMLAMALDRETKGFTKDTHDIPVPLWEETRIVHTGTYTGSRFIGQVYEIENLTSQPLTFHEQEFVTFIPDTRAVALRHFTLPAGTSTSLYIVRDNTMRTEP